MTRREVGRGLAATGIAALAGGALSGCEQNDALGREQLLLVSDAQLAQLAIATWYTVLHYTPRSQDARARARVNAVGPRIVEAAHRSFPEHALADYDWEFEVFDDDQINAWVMPGGKVGFYTGILDVMENDDQLAAVMGHEVGHVVGRHAAERYSQELLAQIGTAAAVAALTAYDTPYGGEIAAVLGAGVTFGVILPYSRRHEYEADRLGVDFMRGGGYAAPEALRFWEKLAARSEASPLAFMSTHPSDEERIAALREHLDMQGGA